MTSQNQTSQENKLLEETYKNVKMGADAIITLLPRVNDGDFKTELSSQLCRYEDYAKQSADLMQKSGIRPKEENPVSRISAKMGIAMNAMMDGTTSHHAQMMIEGATMGITDMTRILHESEEKGVSGEALRLAKDVTAYEEDTVERMKNYL